MRVISISIILLLTCIAGYAQEKTEVSLFLKKDKNHNLDRVESESGNMFSKVGHHGPAIENQWYALRIYFNKTSAIDLYSKARPGLELKQAKWYPTKTQQRNGWGADYYKVGKTLGLGGIGLWDGSKVVLLKPVSLRTAKVKKDGNESSMEMLSAGVVIQNQKVNVLLRVTVFGDSRKARVEAISADKPVQFVTGINYYKKLKIIKSDNYLATWGIHPEDVAAEKVEVGAALMFNKDDFADRMDDGKQFLLISKPLTYLTTWITSAITREPDINTFDKLINTLNQK